MLETRTRIQMQETAKFAVVFLVIFILGIVLVESLPAQMRAEGMKLGVVFGICIALLGVVMAEEKEQQLAAMLGGKKASSR